MSESQQQLDTRAIEIAREALTRIDMHEKISSDRYKMIEHSIDGLFVEIRKQNSRWIVVGGAIIMTLLSIVGYLIVKVLQL